MESSLEMSSEDQENIAAGHEIQIIADAFVSNGYLSRTQAFMATCVGMLMASIGQEFEAAEPRDVDYMFDDRTDEAVDHMLHLFLDDAAHAYAKCELDEFLAGSAEEQERELAEEGSVIVEDYPLTDVTGFAVFTPSSDAPIVIVGVCKDTSWRHADIANLVHRVLMS
ncbi:ORF70 [Ranid herpesvirus 1]|uniref:ORF70 n=1 Tax=Ranid herpesvirus 1 TaxID=85655 RepID=Q9YQZ8_9VIRU|nr:ORF70 [Ranid herpesvirus 1]AAD12267.1 ORF70 [Ranid herpesvirus 1]